MQRLPLLATIALAFSTSAALADPPFALQITRFENTVSLSFPSDPGSYYILRSGPTPDSTTDVVEMTLGNGILQSLHDSGILAVRPDRGFYRLEQRYLSDPAGEDDGDGDGIPNVTELENPLLFDPLDPSDATEDFDNDGFTNQQELLTYRTNLAAPNAGIIPPRLATLSLQAAKATMDINGFKVGKITFVEGSTDPDPETVELPGTLVLNPVFVECCPAETIPAGATLDLVVSLPPRSGAGFISQANIAAFDGSPENSAAYYQTIDPFNQRTTLADWKTANGFGQPGGEEALAAYFNDADLGFGRRMGMRREDGRIAYYVTNYKTANEAAQGLDTDIATVAMEYSPHPVTGGDPYVKFFTFNGHHPDILQRAERNADPGGRLGAIDLDGFGPKFQPGMCITCHGGIPRQADALGAYPAFGRTGARFIPFDLASFTYPTLPGFSRSNQEAAFKQLNQGVLASIAVTTFSSSQQVEIPDESLEGVAIPLEVYGIPSSIGDLDFSFDSGGECSTDPEDHGTGLNHSFVGDLVVTLTSPPPHSITVTLIDRMGSGANNGRNFCRVRLDDTAEAPLGSAAAELAPFTGSWLPENPLSAFNGANPNGTWTLTVFDLAPFDVGSVNRWSIHITPVDAVKELVEGWYGGPTLPNELFDEAFVPHGWLTPESVAAGGDVVYRDVFAKSCRACHVMQTHRQPLFDFDSYAEFDAFRGAIKNRVFNNSPKPMPMAKRTFDKFWTSGDPDPSQAHILADWLDPPVRFSYSGPPVTIPRSSLFFGSTTEIPIEIPYQGLRFITDLDISFDGTGPGSATPGDTKNGITFASVSQLHITLRSPVFLSANFFAGNFSGNNFFHTRFDDEAPASMTGTSLLQAPHVGSWQPHSPLNVFDGLFPHGTWTLRITNPSEFIGGSAQRFTIHLTLSDPLTAPPP